ncbi:MAG: chemotaxis protein CheA [Proteobacteria bacterium]|nr:chemotaxis protein CheA [Pseudomonadota bacterium]MBU1708909.1 chemotaxis protein CheA [Pseudomonadota bacterium]
MADKERVVTDLLDEMALKIVMIEPGDLSVIGELLELLDMLLGHSHMSGNPALHKMGSFFKSALEKLIMAELDDSSENFDRLGECITQMQESVRKQEKDHASLLESFCSSLLATGFKIDKGAFCGLDAKTHEEPEEEKVAAKASEPAEEAPASESPAAGMPQQGEIPDFLKDRDLLSGFIDEAFEHLEGIEVNILDLEQNPDDINIINNIFRPFHTIKGVSGFLNLKVINTLAHTTENLLDDVRNRKRSMDSDVIDVVLEVGDQLKAMVQNIKDVLENGPDLLQEFDISSFIEKIRAIQAGESQSGPVTVEPQTPVVSETAEESPAMQAEEKSEAVTSTPSAQEEKDSPKQAAATAKAAISASIKVDIEKLDNLVNAVGELVIMQAMVRQNPRISAIADPKLTRDFSQLSRITSELQKTAMSMRMVPIRQTFQKMIRLVRDLSKKSGKIVDLVMLGEDTEIDRNMVDSIYDPLVHMIRNSVDHGVQLPSEREQVGKPGMGSVQLSAYQKGGNIVIEIIDDGQGLNTDKIRQKALERGLVKEGDNLSDHELNNLIFLPGFSTADKITDVSGRGVGMDVVKKAVEKLRGKVEVISTPGKGSQFVIRLPLTLAIIDGIIVRVGNERYIIPTISIQESMRPLRENYNTVHGKGETLMVRNSLVPIIRLYEKFGVEPSQKDPCQGIVVIIENEGRQRALMVDELLGKQEVVIKSLGGYMKDIPGVAGGTILADGRVGLILDMAGIISGGGSSEKGDEDDF